MLVCSGLSHCMCAMFIDIAFEESKLSFQNPLVRLSSFFCVASLLNKSLVIFRRYGMLRSFVVVTLQSNKQSVSLPVFVPRYEHKDSNQSSV